MKLRADQLSARLAAGLAPVYLISSDEPLLLEEALDAIRARAKESGMDERDTHIADRGFDWELLPSSLSNLSLFSSGKLVELRLPAAAPGDAGSKCIRELAARPADCNVIVLICPALKRKTADSAWVTAVVKHGVWLDAPVPSLQELPRWIGRRLQAAGLTCDDQGIDLIAGRVEGNLLAAQQEIDKLAMLYPAKSALTGEQVRDAVADGARYDVFQLGDAALAGELQRAARILTGLREEGVAPPLVLWALAREVLVLVDAAGRAARGMPAARAVAEAGIWQSRAELFIRALRAQPPGGFTRLVAMAARADQVVKGARPGEPWNALLELTFAIAGRADATAELA